MKRMKRMNKKVCQVFLLVAVLVMLVAAAPLTLVHVGAPVPGVGPVGVAVAESHAGTFVLIANYQNDDIRNFRIDPATGILTLLGTASTGDGPSAVAVSGNGKFVACANRLTNDVSALRLDPATGLLTLMGTAPSGGSGPSSVAVSDDGYVLVANRDSDSLGVLQIDPATGLLTLMGTQTVGTAPADVAISGRNVIVGHAISNDVHYLELDRDGTLYPMGTAAVGARVTAVAIDEWMVAAATYPNGRVHGFSVRAHHLWPIGSYSSGGDITDLAFSPGGTLFATGINPGRLAAFDLNWSGMQQVGSLPLGGLSSRTLATVGGWGRASWVIVNEYNNNRTLVVSATSSP